MDTTLRDPDTGELTDPRGDYWTRITRPLGQATSVTLTHRIARAQANTGRIKTILGNHQLRPR